MHPEAVEVRNMNIRDKPPAGAAAVKGTSLIVGHLPLPSVSRPAPIDNISHVTFSPPGITARDTGGQSLGRRGQGWFCSGG